MRPHTASGTAPALALAPGPTAAGFLGNRMRGWAPAGGAGRGPAGTGAAARGRESVLIRCALVAAGRGGGFDVLLALDAVEVVVDTGRADEVAASLAAGEPAPQPARTRQVTVVVTVVAAFVALAVRLLGMVRSVRSGSGRFPVCHGRSSRRV